MTEEHTFNTPKFSASKAIALCTIVGVILSISTTAVAKKGSEIKTIKAEKVGMSTQRLEQISELGQGYVDKDQYSGIVTLVARKGKIVHLQAHGNYGVDNPKPLETDTLFRIYSMTKPITAVAAMTLYEQGKFHMNDPVSKYLPEFSEQKILVNGELKKPKSEMTMRQLFTHTAGLSYGFTQDNQVDLEYQKAQLFASKDLNEFISKATQLPLLYEPGTRYHYSISMDILGAVIERLSGMSLDQYFRTVLFEPLQMHDTYFSVPENKLARLASDQYWDAKANKILTVPEAQSQSYLNRTLFMGGGGLVSTAADYFQFAQMVLNGGSLNGVRILGPKTVEYLSSNHLSDKVRNEGEHNLHAGQTMALGFGLVTNSGLMPAVSSVGELSWAGLAGTKFWIDPKEELITIGLVQLYRTPWPLRYDLKATSYQAITELNE
jgi:CubicO group peptidase (beta-lactamase class C family)